MFENPTLDKMFQRSLVIERKVAPRGRIPQSCPYTTPPPLTHPTPIPQPAFHLLGLKTPHPIQLQGHPGAHSTKLLHTIHRIVKYSKI